MKKHFLLLLTILCAAIPGHAQRQDLDWNAGWRFVNGDLAPSVAYIAQNWTPVTIPHTWNADNYRRGAGWYAKTFEAPASWKNKRIFARFEAVSLSADVYLNGQKIERHEGGFTAFCVELTPFLKIGAANEMLVRADNSDQGIAPLSADFNFCGGIYRPVHLIVTDAVCISPLDFGSSGVALSQKMDGQDAQIEVATLLSNGGEANAQVPVRVSIFDANNQRVADATTNAAATANASTPVVQTLTIPNAHLWQGKIDPYLYRVQVSVGAVAVADVVEEKLGVRTVSFDTNGKFRLNGALYPLHGVNRHQDWKGKGWALTPADHERDLQLIREIGATTVRLAHYPQSHVFLDGADRDGLMLWEEIPIVNTIGQTPHFAENARLQLTEMIKQNRNHPSIFVWGLFNEQREVDKVSPAPLIENLNTLAHELDSSRPTTGASNHPELGTLNRAPDVIGFNMYPGWYGGKPGDYANNIASDSQKVDNKTIALSEYGAGASVIQHQEGELSQVGSTSEFHPEEWQTFVHQEAWKAIQGNPKMWGSYVWNMFDFAVQNRDEGDRPNINDKGLVTDDRAIGKDSFYFYKANWNPEPMIYIAARRMTPRVRPLTQIKVFSTASEVELKVNGKSVGKAKPDEVKVFRWNKVALKNGTNLIEVSAMQNGKMLSDSCQGVVARTVPNTVAP